MAARSKYLALGQFLAAQPPAVQAVTLTFTEIERIIGAPLPTSARGWSRWSNAPRTNPPARAWLHVGWRVQQFNRWLANPTVTFVRQVPA